MDYLQKIKVLKVPKHQKINEKSLKKMIDDEMDVGLDFEGILGRFWMDFGRVWGEQGGQKSRFEYAF